MKDIRLEQATIQGFGRLRNREVTFRPGLNLILGPNEAGKSTLQRFIRAMLFGMKKPGVNRYTPDLDRFHPWEGDKYGGILRLTAGDRTFRIERSFASGHETTAAFDDLTGEDLTGTFPQDGRREYLIAETLLGVNQVVFDNTICIRQLASSTEADLAKEVNARLANLSQSKEVDISVQKALTALDKVLGELGTVRGVKTHLLGQAAERVRVLEEEAADVSTLHQELWSDAALLSSLQQEIAALEAQLRDNQAAKAAFELAALRERLAALKQIQGQISYLHQQLDPLEARANFPVKHRDELHRLVPLLDELSAREEKTRKSIAESQQRLTSIKGSLAGLAADGTLGPDAIQQASQIITSLKLLENDRRHLNEEYLRLSRDLKEKASMPSSPVRWPVVLAASVTLLGVIMTAILQQGIPTAGLEQSMPFPGIAAAVLAVVFGLSWWALRGVRETRRRQLYRQEAQRRLSEISDRLEQYRIQRDSSLTHLKNLYGRAKLDMDLETEIAAASEDTLSRFIGVVNALQGQRAELRTEEHLLREAEGELGTIAFQRQGLQQQRDAILQQAGVANAAAFDAACQEYETWQNLNQRLALLEERVSTLLQGETEDTLLEREDELAAQSGEKPAPGADPSAGLGDLIASLQAKREESVRLQSRIDTLMQGKRPLAEIEHDLTGARAYLAELSDHQAAAALAKESISSLTQDIQREFTPSLNQSVSSALNRITAGRYQEVRISPDLSMSLVEPENSRLIPIQSLSHGTVDQVYLALRLAVADLLTGEDVKLPLILDDSFVQYDDRRLAAVLDLLQQESLHRQILLFTCHQRERTLLHAAGVQNLQEIVLA